MSVRDITSEAKKTSFLNDFARHGTIWEAAKHAGIGRQTHYDWLANDPDYKPRFEAARAEFAEWLEAGIRKQATRARNPNPTLAIFLMKKWNPEFRDNYKVELGNAGGVPLSIDVHFVNAPDATGEG